MTPGTKTLMSPSEAFRGWIALPRGKCVHELFAMQAERTPDATAIVFGPERLTYSDLERRSNQLAHYLLNRGVGPETIVGLCVERSPAMIVGLLGILKAGAAYLPLDPAHPQERLNFMIVDSGASVVVTQKSLATKLSTDAGGLLCLDAEWQLIESERATAPALTVRLENLVYVIYTSGSTGTPKGVMITHAGLNNYLSWAANEYLDQDSNGSLVHTPLAFDLTVTSLFTPLICGLQVTLMPEQSALEDLSAAISQGPPLSLLKITPAHIEGLHYTLATKKIRGRLRVVVIGGEALRAESIDFLRTADPELRIINEYGPTETVVGCSVHEVSRNDPPAGPVSIGQPIANTTAYVLDKEFCGAPTGVTGELFIGGAGVARGYLNRPELTAERFLPDPFANQPGQRLYATGDLARLQPNGDLDFVGRNDDQVKIRGHRVELPEIEAVLRQHASVKETVVVLQDFQARDIRLAAFVVPVDSSNMNIAELRDFLKAKLPEYMVPPAIFELETMPLTTNGKIDRRALAKLASATPQRSEEYIGPRDDIEEGLVKIWEDLLGVSPVGISDNFFDLGGHSLHAARFCAEIEERYDRRIPLATLLENPTIEGFARFLRGDGCEASWSSLVKLQPEGSKPPLFCVHACGAHVFIYRPLIHRLSDDQPIYGVQAKGLDGKEECPTRIEEMAANYVKEIRGIQPQGPYYLLGDTLGGLIALEIAQQLYDQGQVTAFLGLLDTSCPLPKSIGERVLAHLTHVKELGPRQYVLETTLSVRRKLARLRSKEIPLTSAEKEFERSVLSDSDPISRVEWAIYQATIVNYQVPKRIYPGKITYFFARDNIYEAREEDKRLRWKTIAGGGFELHVIPGRHDTIKEEPHVALLSRKLMACLDEARSSVLSVLQGIFLAVSIGTLMIQEVAA